MLQWLALQKTVWINLIDAGIKFAGYGTILFIADHLISTITLPNWALWFTDCILTLVGVLGDAIVLPVLGNVKSLCIGSVGMVAILWFAPRLMFTHISLAWAIVIALIIVPLEYALHSWLLQTIHSDKAQG